MAANNKELKALITLAGKVDPTLQKSLLDTQKKTQGVGDKMQLASKVGQKAMGVLKNAAKATAVGIGALAAAGAAMFVKLGKEGFDSAVKLEQANKQINHSFGDNAAEIDSWSKSLLNAYGMSESSAKQYASEMGSVFKNLGVEGDELASMTQNLTMRSADMASFYGMEQTEMATALQEAVNGSGDALKKLGIDMSDTKLQAFAMSQGLGSNIESLSDAEMATLRYNYLMSETSEAQGDFANSTDNVANQQKLFKERLTQLSTTVMSKVLPVASKLLDGFGKFMDTLDMDMIGGFAEQIGNLALEFLPIIQDILPVMLSAVSTLLPPLLQIVKAVLPPMVSFLKVVLGVVSKIISGGAKVIDAIVSIFSGGGSEPKDVPEIPMFADGGFANRPSIFGETGPEAAIPIKRGNPRSIMLLQKTAELLGLKGGNPFGGEGGGLPTAFGVNITYAPVINGGDPKVLAPMLKQHSLDIEAIFERWDNNRRRVSFG